MAPRGSEPFVAGAEVEPEAGGPPLAYQMLLAKMSGSLRRIEQHLGDQADLIRRANELGEALISERAALDAGRASLERLVERLEAAAGALTDALRKMRTQGSRSGRPPA